MRKFVFLLLMVWAACLGGQVIAQTDYDEPPAPSMPEPP
eukprot:gene18919-13643_t